MRLLEACRKAKTDLSFSEEHTISVDALFGGNDFEFELTRAAFEARCDELFYKITEPIDRAIEGAIKAKAISSKNDIEAVIMAGGSTRMQKVDQVLIEYFGKDILKKVQNPDESIS